MRSHLVSCLEKGQMSSFPSIHRNVSTCSVVAQETIQISCSCRMPRVGRMIQCCCCKEWYHKKCENVTRNWHPLGSAGCAPRNEHRSWCFIPFASLLYVSVACIRLDMYRGSMQDTRRNITIVRSIRYGAWGARKI